MVAIIQSIYLYLLLCSTSPLVIQISSSAFTPTVNVQVYFDGMYQSTNPRGWRVVLLPSRTTSPNNVANDRYNQSIRMLFADNYESSYEEISF